jgi:hypothetical protein
MGDRVIVNAGAGFARFIHHAGYLCGLMKESQMIKSIVLALAAVGGTLGAGVAHAGGVSWSVGVNVPFVGAVVGNAPVYRQAYVAPVYAPAPAYYAPAYGPAPVYVAPAYYAPGYYGGYYRARPVVYPYRHAGWGYGHYGYRR